MTAMAPSLLDDFNRANVSPIDNGNLNYFQGMGDIFPRHVILGRLSLTSNRMQGVLSSSNAFWNSFWVASLFTNLECYATVGVLGIADGGAEMMMYLRGQNLGNGGTPPVFRSYFLNIIHTTSMSIAIDRSNGITATYLNGVVLPRTLAVGDSIGMRCYDQYGYPLIEAWFKPSGGSWSRVCAVRDILDPVYGSGAVGLGVSTQTNGIWGWDDWNAGSISSPLSTISSDSFPGFTGAKPDPTSDLIPIATRPGLILAPPVYARQDPIAVPAEQINVFSGDPGQYGGGASGEII